MQPDWEPPHSQRQHVRMLRAIRKRHGWSQSQLAQQLQVSRRMIIRWENEQQEPPTYLMAALREMLSDLTASGSVA